MEYQKLKVEINEKVGLITIDNPPLNSLPGELLRNLDLCFKQLADDKNVKVIILTGAGKSFATGADIAEMGECKSAHEASEMSRLGQKVFRNIERCPKPIIAAINGFCLGGGLELALSCHIRIASDKCVFGMPEIQIGMIPAFGGSFRLPAIIGTSRAFQMILTAEKIDSNEAKSLRLVNSIFSPETLLDNAQRLARTISKMSSASIRLAQNTILGARFSNLDDTMRLEASSVGELYDLHDLREGVHAYLEKRKPEFLDY